MLVSRGGGEGEADMMLSSRAPKLRLRALGGLELRELRVSGFGFRVSCFGFRV